MSEGHADSSLEKVGLDSGASAGHGVGKGSFVFGSLRYDPVTLDRATDCVMCYASGHAAGSLVVTPNIHHLKLAASDRPFAEILIGADLSVADGWPLVFASRLLGKRLPERVAGIDLVDAVLHRCNGLRVAVLGGAPEAGERLRDGRLHSAGSVHLEALRPGSWEDGAGRAALIKRVRRFDPDLTLIGVGAPKQEILGHELRLTIAGPVVCCGAAIDVLSGETPRAPAVLQRIGLEWMFRAALEPKRLLRRYLHSGFKFLTVLTKALFSRALPPRRGVFRS